ncbi:aldo/keto reductase [Dipodascopsis tothii]|uniref:aldo/keto reductase n=1 Tax=Dipodascopsis tothii TaxID=44089 RepID=UPI0034CE741E
MTYIYLTAESSLPFGPIDQLHSIIMVDKQILKLPSGTIVPRMIYGTAWKKFSTDALVFQALKAGFRGVDTACQPKHYREDLVGQGIAAFLKDQATKDTGLTRENLYIQTKFTPINGQDLKQPLPYSLNSTLEDQVRQSTKTSLENLQISYIDTLVLHSPLATLEDTARVWQTMEEIRSTGIVRNIGLSNTTLDIVLALVSHTNIKPSVIQNRLYSDTDYDKKLREWATGEGVVYQSFWTLTANPHLLRAAAVISYANQLSISCEQSLYSSVLKEDICIINGTTSQKHMAEDLALLSSYDVPGKSLEDLI